MSNPSPRQYASEKEHPAYKIFHWLFEVLVPQAYTFSESELALYGHTSSGNKHYDAQLAGEKTRVMWSISRMAVAASNGCPMILVKPTDAPKIHQLIMEYMEVWQHDLEVKFGWMSLEEIRNNEEYRELESDILTLEAFAEIIHPVAASNVPKGLQANSLLARLRAIGVSVQPGSTNTVERPVVSVDAPTAFNNSLSGKPARGTARWQ